MRRSAPSLCASTASMQSEHVISTFARDVETGIHPLRLHYASHKSATLKCVLCIDHSWHIDAPMVLCPCQPDDSWVLCSTWILLFLQAFQAVTDKLGSILDNRVDPASSPSPCIPWR